ncbi:MAG: ATP synthase subunit I [Candidatus Zipacnadales bacterium]
MMNDERVFQPVALITIVLVAIGFVGLAASFPLSVGTNFVLGASAGLASLGTLAAMVHRLEGREAGKGRRQLWLTGLLQLGKYGLIAGGLYILFCMGNFSVPALAGGFTLPTAVLCLREARRQRQRRVDAKASTPKATNRSNDEKSSAVKE